MTGEEMDRLLDLVGNRTDELGLLTRKLIGEHLSMCARGQTGNVDTNGDIIDEALLGRIEAAVGDDRADDVGHASQVQLAHDLLALAMGRA